MCGWLACVRMPLSETCSTILHRPGLPPRANEGIRGMENTKRSRNVQRRFPISLNFDVLLVSGGLCS